MVFVLFTISSVAVLEIINKITVFSVGIFVDLFQAFDTFHKILDKLQYYTVRGIVLGWFKLYLTNET